MTEVSNKDHILCDFMYVKCPEKASPQMHNKMVTARDQGKKEIESDDSRAQEFLGGDKIGLKFDRGDECTTL